MSTEQVITEGAATYTKPAGRWTCWTYTDTATGESWDTGTDLITDARARVYDRIRAQQAQRYTIASGPQRARAGHQRFVGARQFA